MTYSPEHLTNLLTTDREKLTQICAPFYDRNIYDYDEDRQCYVDDNLRYYMDECDFQPLANTEKGRSQAFELLHKFKLNIRWLPVTKTWAVESQEYTLVFKHKDLQAAIVGASILTAQQENNDE